MSIIVERVDLIEHPEHGEIVLSLLNEYALHPMGGGEELKESTKLNLISELTKRASTCYIYLAYIDSNPAGLCICFEGFSTFDCKPLLNIHDCVTKAEYRQKGVCSALFARIVEDARTNGFCKVTLEVLSGNGVAIETYKKLGFEGYTLGHSQGTAQFWQKKL